MDCYRSGFVDAHLPRLTCKYEKGQIFSRTPIWSQSETTSTHVWMVISGFWFLYLLIIIENVINNTWICICVKLILIKGKVARTSTQNDSSSLASSSAGKWNILLVWQLVGKHIMIINFKQKLRDKCKREKRNHPTNYTTQSWKGVGYI